MTHYECDGCGACCIHLGIPVDNDDIRNDGQLAFYMTPQLTEIGVGFLGSPQKTGCPLLDNSGACSTYATRPKCCHSLDAGSPLCQYARGRAGLKPLRPQQDAKMEHNLATDKQPVVYVALPSRPGENIAVGLVTALWPTNIGSGFKFYDFCFQPMSLLTTNFNTLWCLARNLRLAHIAGHKAHASGASRDDNPYEKERFGKGWTEGWDEGAGTRDIGPITHFVMVHSDVIPEPGRWLQDLLEEKKRVNADILSVVIPLKDEHGMTSTGVMKWDTTEIKKLSMRETMALPETFTARDAGGDCLLVNTGLWICDITKPWARKVCFRIYDTILEDNDGFTKAVAVGEDWLLGMDAYRLGLRVFATRKIKVTHQGSFRYPNFVDFGTHEGENEWGKPWCIEPPFSWQYEEVNGVPPGSSLNGKHRHAEAVA
jgi:Fe-S-cluster containining protein/ribosome modulation factor